MSETTGTTPEFSIVMPAHNAEATIGASIESVREQSFEGWELVVVDDGSTDRTRQIAEAHASADPRISVIAQANAGAASARNRGAQRACGDLVVFLDADDRLDPKYLAVMRETASQRPDIAVYACNSWNEYANGTRALLYRGAVGREVRIEDEIRGPEIPIFSVVRATAFASVGGFRDLYAEDYDLWLRILARGSRVLRLPDPLVAYDASLSGKSGSREQQLASVRESLSALTDDRELAPAVIERCRRRIRELDHELQLLPTKERLRRGEYSGARAQFMRHRSAMPVPWRYVVLATVLVSPRLYRALVMQRDPNAG